MIYKCYKIKGDVFEITLKPCVDGGVIIEVEDYEDPFTYRMLELKDDDIKNLIDVLFELTK